MRFSRGVNIDDLIVHIVDVRGSGSVVLSERSLPLTGNDRIKDYFVAHIENSLADPAAKAASFIDPAHNVASLCAQLLNGTCDFVGASQNLWTAPISADSGQS
jgi:hypothetical protein